MFNSNTAHLLLSQEIDIMNFFSYISYRPNIIWYACDERKYFFTFSVKVVFVETAPASLERFTFLFIELNGLDDLPFSNFAMREERPHSEFFWSVFSRIRAKYRPEKL